MSNWPVFIAVAVLVVLAWALLEGRLLSAVRLRRLIRQGQYISAKEAIRKCQDRSGVLVLNKSLLPGRWWFLGNAGLSSNCDRMNALRKFGKVVICDNEVDRQSIEEFCGEADEVLEPFDE
jgi:hypothetical protein